MNLNFTRPGPLKYKSLHANLTEKDPTHTPRAIFVRAARRVRLALCVMSHSRIGEEGGQARSKQQEAFLPSSPLLSVVNQTAASCENISTIEAFCGLKEESCDYKHRSSLDRIYNKMVIVHVHREFRGEREDIVRQL